jgi:hypothetical protein
LLDETLGQTFALLHLDGRDKARAEEIGPFCRVLFMGTGHEEFGHSLHAVAAHHGPDGAEKGALAILARAVEKEHTLLLDAPREGVTHSPSQVVNEGLVTGRHIV